ncbi:MAG TPA: tripartite tricarboxylate transporter TctB family protein [Caldimonas sp.]|nr:tripartite tricarboxylate transporter TctB family protein [Caldimonas sp.]HEX2540410.1 tripartite tricarboxylate transporter TctB family protein [Caldimonas sp.]
MKLDDAVWGVLFALLGAAVLVHVQGFPRIPGQNIGPGIFPGLVGSGLGICGLLLILRSWRRRRGAERARWVEAPAWMRSGRQVLAFAVLVGANLFYLLAVERLGFVLTAFAYLTALMWVLRVRWAVLLPIAAIATLLIHLAFSRLLKVPLPWGVLQRWAW